MYLSFCYPENKFFSYVWIFTTKFYKYGTGSTVLTLLLHIRTYLCVYVYRYLSMISFFLFTMIRLSKVDIIKAKHRTLQTVNLAKVFFIFLIDIIISNFIINLFHILSPAKPLASAHVSLWAEQWRWWWRGRWDRLSQWWSQRSFLPCVHSSPEPCCRPGEIEVILFPSSVTCVTLCSFSCSTTRYLNELYMIFYLFPYVFIFTGEGMNWALPFVVSFISIELNYYLM